MVNYTIDQQQINNMLKIKQKDKVTKVKLAEFGVPKSAEIRPVESLIKNYETIKNRKKIRKPNSISLFSIEQRHVNRVFI